MGDQYQEISEPADAADTGTSGWGGGHDTLTYQQHEDAGPEHGNRNDYPGETAGYDGHDGYQETYAEVQARIASQDELPTSEESRAATWGDSPEYYDEADLAAEYDGDASVFRSWEDDLPTPEESRAATWGDHPQFYDETDPDAYDGGLGASATGDGDSGQTDTTDRLGESVSPPEVTADDHTPPDYTQSARLDRAGFPAADASTPSSPEADRLKALETEHDAAWEKIADLEARNRDLVAKNDEQAARIDEQDTRLDGIEQMLAGTSRRPGDASTPEHDPGDQPAKNPSIANRKDTRQGADAAESGSTRWRRAISSENLDVLQTLGGTGEAVAALAMHATPDGVAGLVLAGIGVAKLAMTKYEKKRKGKA